MFKGGVPKGFGATHTTLVVVMTNAEAVQVSLLSAQRKSKDQIAVQLGVNGVNGACQSIVSHLRNLRCLDFVQLGIGHDDDQRRVGSSKAFGHSPLEHAFHSDREFG